MVLEPNSLDWNGNYLEHKLELENMKRTIEVHVYLQRNFQPIVSQVCNIIVL